MTRSSSAVDVALLTLLLAACITGGGHPRQLYPGDPRPPARDGAAHRAKKPSP